MSMRAFTQAQIFLVKLSMTYMIKSCGSWSLPSVDQCSLAWDEMSCSVQI